jgi:hypothetical protein
MIPNGWIGLRLRLLSTSSGRGRRLDQFDPLLEPSVLLIAWLHEGCRCTSATTSGLNLKTDWYQLECRSKGLQRRLARGPRRLVSSKATHHAICYIKGRILRVYFKSCSSESHNAPRSAAAPSLGVARVGVPVARASSAAGAARFSQQWFQRQPQAAYQTFLHLRVLVNR